MQIGLNGNQSINDAGEVDFPHSLYRQLDLMSAAGAKWVRVNFRLGAYYQNWSDRAADGSYPLDKYDQLISKAKSLGIAVLGLISPETWHGSQASWQDNSSGDGFNGYIAALTNAFHLLALHYPSITLWEIWNEPNVWTESPGKGGSYIYPVNFAAMLESAHAAVSGVQLVSGGLTVFDWDNGYTYLKQTYTAGRQHFGWRDWPMAYIGQHYYIKQGSVIAERDLSKNFFRETRPIVITEVGWQTTNVTEQVQAQNLQTTYNAAMHADNVAGVYWFSVQDAPEAQLLFGLQTGGDQNDNYVGTPKQSFSTFQGVGTVPLPPAYTGNAKKALDIEWNTLGDLTDPARGAVPMDGDYGQLHAEWLTLKISKGHNLGSPVTTFKDSVDWNGNPIKLILFLNGRAELTPANNTIRWWDAKEEVTLSTQKKGD